MLKTSIPFVDLRGRTLIDLLRSYPDRAHALVGAARRTYGVFSNAASALVLPLADRRSHKWLKRSRNPYLYEIETFADILGIRGVYALNLSYEWGCTTGAYRTDENVTMLRVLDWPFPALGNNLMVALQQAKAGEYYNLTWPAVAGVYTGMAPGRFSAALNLAPMRMHGKGYVGDWIKNRMMINKEQGLPPAHLLRQVFEQAKDFEAAKDMLTKTAVAAPVIFTLAGIKGGQGCVIERLENAAEVSELGAGRQVTASNHFNSAIAAQGQGWRPREQDSPGRHKQSCGIHGHDLSANHFDWLQAPMINQFTRLCCISNAATRRLVVQGYEGMAQVTEIFNLPAESYGKQASNQ